MKPPGTRSPHARLCQGAGELGPSHQTRELMPLQHEHIKSLPWWRRQRFSTVLAAPAKPEQRPPPHQPPAPSPAQVRMPQPGKATTTAGAEGQAGGGEERRSHEAHPEVRDLQEPTGSNPKGGQAAHFELPRDVNSPSAPQAMVTSTASAQAKQENTQNKPYLHPKSTAPHLDEGMQLLQHPCHTESGTAPSPSAARFRAGCPGTAV